MLGSVDANTGSPDLGWDTDQFPMDVKNATLVTKVQLIVKPGSRYDDRRSFRKLWYETLD